MNNHKHNPIVICIEGGDGSGKGTLIKLLIAYLQSLGKRVLSLREPGGSSISEQIRAVIMDEKNILMDATTEALLFAASRAQLLKEILFPAINSREYDYIILDRYVWSSFVYQGYARGENMDDVITVNQVATGGWYPDMSIFLDIDPEVAQSRIAANGRETNRLDKESIAFHQKVREGYKLVADKFADKAVIHMVNADQTPQEILDEVIALIQ